MKTPKKQPATTSDSRAKTSLESPNKQPDKHLDFLATEDEHEFDVPLNDLDVGAIDSFDDDDDDF